jgi:hypothetical protein
MASIDVFSIRSGAVESSSKAHPGFWPLVAFCGIGAIAFIAFAAVLAHFGQLPMLITEYNLM